MRKSMMLALAVTALNFATGGSAQAERYYAWCAYYDPMTYNCGFETKQQCDANIRGMGGACAPNVREPPPAPVFSSPPVSYPEVSRRPKR